MDQNTFLHHASGWMMFAVCANYVFTGWLKPQFVCTFLTAVTVLVSKVFFALHLVIESFSESAKTAPPKHMRALPWSRWRAPVLYSKTFAMIPRRSNLRTTACEFGMCSNCNMVGLIYDMFFFLLEGSERKNIDP